MATEKIHVFEKAGLGVAPFTFVGFHVERGPIKTEIGGVVVEVGSAGQPMGTCEYCGNGIANCYEIESADGKRFIVGSECVAKTGDKGMKADIDKIKVAARHEKDDAKISENLEWVESNREALSKMQYGRYTFLESIEWHYKNSGRAGKIRIIKAAKAAMERNSQ